MSALLGGCDHGPDYSEFEALNRSRTGSFELDMNPDDAFPLFTAPGEELWAPGWEPFILNGDGYEEGTVWITMGHGHTAYWYVSRYDTAERRAQYVRVTPGANAGTVNVHVASNGNGGSTVSVTYNMTGLSDAGNKNMESFFDEHDYAAMMDHWRKAIDQNRDKIDDHFGR